MTIEKNSFFEKELESIFLLIDEKRAEEACTNFLKLIESMEYELQSNSCNTINSNLAANIYFSFAQLLIHLSEFESGIYMLMKAQHHKKLNNDISDYILNVFVLPNIELFKKNYTENLKCFIQSTIVDFDDLEFFPIITENEDKFFFYHKSSKLLYDKNESQILTSEYTLNKVDSFSGYTAIIEWNLNDISDFFDAINSTDSELAILSNDYPLFLSSLQFINANQSILKSAIHLFASDKDYINYYKQNSSYLCRNLIAHVNNINFYRSIIADLHTFRISDEGRHGDNILLSICIPTYNRGKRALENVLHTIQSHFDEEIEIVISNNGTENNTKKYYNQLANNLDSRIKYHRHSENLGLSINVCSSIEMANGKFVILLSDEDILYLDQIESILSICKKHADSLSVVRSSHVTQGKLNTTGLFNKGKDALLGYMMTSNYISGIIFNRTLINDCKVIDYIKQHQENNACYYYPHMVIELFIAQYGDILGIDMFLFMRRS